MRIIHIITRLILGGAQENTLLTCEDLLRQYGDQVLLVTGPPEGPEGSLLERARAGGVPMVLLPSLCRPIAPWRDLVSYLALRRIIRRFQPEVVHTHSAKAGILGRAVAWQLRVPVIVHTVHGAPFHPYQPAIARWFFRACERWAARRCHRLVCVAQALADQLAAAGVAEREKMITIYSGMEVQPFLQADRYRAEYRERLGWGPEYVVVGKIARLFYLKGHEYLLEAAPKIVAQMPKVRFLLIGDGILRPKIQQQIRQAGLADYFRLVGLVPPEEIPRWIAAMDILVHVSLREGLARALPQALLVGRPVVSFDIDGAREVVLPEKTGLLLRPKDSEALAEAVVRLAKDPELRTQMGLEGRRRCHQVFRHQHMTAQLRALYEQLFQEATLQGRVHSCHFRKGRGRQG
ncbi:MAG: glycosyltransferase family 4 protein [Thermoguttaceae bacterium]|nr:glycosyltransferase family 4 protein [Thermoguttaceae bacterium]MDW8038782.1 glycosyltransferase family 4 protein [Thermoguttaceae bacterium]